MDSAAPGPDISNKVETSEKKNLAFENKPWWVCELVQTASFKV